MHCLAATDSETKTFVALPSAEDLDIEEKLSRIEVVAASIVKLPKSGKNKAKKGTESCCMSEVVPSTDFVRPDPSSGPPSPPNDVASARVTIGPCPARLKPYIPPPNYGTVELDKVFRSSFPQDRNIDFVKTLQIRSILYG
jgi:tyrosine-protein phosphatase SIW14